MTAIGTGFAALNMTQKLTRIGIGVAIVLALVGLVLLYGHSQYQRGHDKGVADVDAQWAAADAKLKAEAAQSATRADDAAAERVEQHRIQAEDDRKAVEDAKAKGDSPLDALFGG